VLHVPFPTNIDIRDTVNYKEVMKQYRLGPNGAIMTSLNLFSTQFHQVVNLIESKAQDLEYGSPTFTSRRGVDHHLIASLTQCPM